MRTRLFLIHLLALWLTVCAAAVASAQGNVTTGPRDLDALNECSIINVSGMGVAGIQVTGTYVGTITWTVAIDGGTYVAIDAFTPDAPSTAVNSTTSTGVWTATVAGLRTLRACMTAYTSGRATVVLAAAATGGGGSGGSSGSGDGAIQDGVTSAIAATVFSRVSSNPLSVVQVDSNGDIVGGDAVTQSTSPWVTSGTIRDGVTAGTLATVFSRASSNPISVMTVDSNGEKESASNAAASATGAAVPASASYTGVNISGNNTGVTGLSLGSQRAVAVSSIDSAGNQLFSSPIQVDIIDASLPVTATNLDVQIGGSDTVTVTATNLDVQSGGVDLATSTQAAAIQTAVEIMDDWDASDRARVLYVDTGGNAVTVIGNALSARLTDSTVSFNQSSTANDVDANLIAGAALSSAAAGSNRPLDVIILDTAGNRLNPATDWTIGADIGSGAPGLVGRASRGTPPTTQADGKAQAVWVSSTGEIQIAAAQAIPVNIVAGAAAGGTSSNFSSAMPGAGTAAGGSAARPDGSGPTAVDAGEMQAVWVDTAGRVQGNWQSVGPNAEVLDLGQKPSYSSLPVVLAQDTSPCSDALRVSDAVVSIDTLGNTQVVALSAGKKIYVCGYKLVTTSAMAFYWISGTGTNCGTGETAEEGSQAYAANGGVVEPNGGSVQFSTAFGGALCLKTGAATHLGGRVTYVQQ